MHLGWQLIPSSRYLITSVLLVLFVALILPGCGISGEETSSGVITLPSESAVTYDGDGLQKATGSTGMEAR